ncbi:uncharacterized protein LOC110028985 isoform X2 [Phalaenopsis equestris]|uniref:uncharacterized protein LOC110028985 isoform X2 n=1 Tax=Phalaenopsis equestris TaxID=78828 RepID=UPI0009E5696D|nr:uncharacterized protein LOC110028985 isoform X2 [Phalaenopsis equestris]
MWRMAAMWRMAKSFFDGARAGTVCYFKARPSRFAYSISCLLSMFFIRSTSSLRIPAVRILFPVTRRKHFPFLTYVWHAIDQAKRVEESAVVRRALRPVEFFGLKFSDHGLPSS